MTQVVASKPEDLPDAMPAPLPVTTASTLRELGNAMKKTLLAAGLLPVAAMAASSTDTSQPQIVVTATRFAEPEASILAPVNIVTRQEIERLQAKSVTDVIKTLPGIETINYGGKGQNSSTAVRGGTASQTLVLVDGVRFNSVTSGGADLNTFPINQVERIEYVRGARASIYGADAIGGVINIITRPDPGTTEHKVSIGAGSRQQREASWTSSARIAENGQLKAAASYQDEEGYNVHPVAGVNDGDKHGYTGYNALLDYQHQLNNQFGLFAAGRWFRNKAQYDNSYNNAWGQQHQRNETWSDNQSYQLGGRYHLNGYQSELQGNIGREDIYNYPDSQSRDDAKNKTYIRQYNLSWLHDLALNDVWRLGAGVDWRRDKLDADSRSDGLPYPAATTGRDNTGVYSLLQYQWSQWQAEVSGRSDDNEEYGRHNTWQTGAGWRFLEDYRLSARYGTGFRAPSFNDLYYPDPYMPGNPDLHPEESRNRELMLDGVSGVLTWRMTGYRNDIDQMIQWAPNNSGLWRPENVGKARIDGLELEGEFDTGWLAHRISLEFKDPQDLSKDKQLQRIARRNAKWVAQGEWQQYSGSLSWIYQGERYDDASNSVTLGGYSVWDLAVGYKPAAAWKLNGKIANLLDKEYESAQGYPAAGRSVYLSVDYLL